MWELCLGEDVVVSIASPKLFKDVARLFDQFVEGSEMKKLLRPLIGENSLQYMNGDKWRQHRKIHEHQYRSDDFL